MLKKLQDEMRQNSIKKIKEKNKQIAELELKHIKETKEKVLAGVRRLSNSTTRLVIVTNEVNADINGYSEETEKYRECIGMVNQSLAELADIVTEVVYGIPVCIRKEQKKYEEYKKNME